MIQNFNDIHSQEAQLKDRVKYKTECFIYDPDTTKQQLIEMVNGVIEMWTWYLAEMLEEEKYQKHDKEIENKKLLIEKFIRDLETLNEEQFNTSGGENNDTEILPTL